MQFAKKPFAFHKADLPFYLIALYAFSLLLARLLRLFWALHSRVLA